ncbi:hypothetical protein Tco_0389125, partial [Tanacetum coccineum]
MFGDSIEKAVDFSASNNVFTITNAMMSGDISIETTNTSNAYEVPGTISSNITCPTGSASGISGNVCTSPNATMSGDTGIETTNTSNAYEVPLTGLLHNPTAMDVVMDEYASSTASLVRALQDDESTEAGYSVSCNTLSVESPIITTKGMGVSNVFTVNEV